MAKSFYSHMADAWKTYGDKAHFEIRQKRLYQWRRESVFTRVEHPTRLDRARGLGYKAKQGYVVVRTRTRKGSMRKKRFKMGLKPSAMGVKKITMSKSIQRMSEERTQKHYPNMQVLNSYWVGEDGRHKYYEIILVDPSHPVILADRKINWIATAGNTKRVYRGKTSAGQRGRGLHKKGKGTEKNRPSIRANDSKRQ